jgi:hypothetical protein
VVGNSSLPNGDQHVFLWEDGQITDLTLTDRRASVAFAMNNVGQILMSSNSTHRNYIWDNGVMIDLLDQIWPPPTLQNLSPYEINDQGQITGTGFIGGTPHAFLLTPSRTTAAVVTALHNDSPNSGFPTLPALLQNHSGSTVASLPWSPAIASGDNTGAPEWDQRGRGFPRIVNGKIDIGAFELQASGAPGMAGDLAVLLTADLSDSKFKDRRLR